MRDPQAQYSSFAFTTIGTLFTDFNHLQEKQYNTISYSDTAKYISMDVSLSSYVSLL